MTMSDECAMGFCYRKRLPNQHFCERHAESEAMRTKLDAARTEAAALRSALEDADEVLSAWWNSMGDGTNKGPFPGLVDDTAELVPKLRALLAAPARAPGTGMEPPAGVPPTSPIDATLALPCVVCGAEAHSSCGTFRSMPVVHTLRVYRAGEPAATPGPLPVARLDPATVGPRDCPTGEGHEDNGTGECTNCGALRADEPCKHGITGPCRACAATPGPLPVARLDPGQIRESMLSVVQMRRELEAARGELATARARLQDNDAAGALRRLDAYFAGQSVPVEVDPVEAILAVECPDCGQVPDARCHVYVGKTTLRMHCEGRIRASRTTTKAGER